MISHWRHKAIPTALAVFLLSPFHAGAATVFDIMNGVSVFADSLNGKSGNFLDQNFASNNLINYISNSAIERVVTDRNPATFAWSPDFYLSPNDGIETWLDLGFSNNIYNGNGNDLVLFFTGNGSNYSAGFLPYQFSLDVGANGTIEAVQVGVTSSTTTFNKGAFVASYALIDLDIYGFDKTTPLGDIRVHLDDDSTPTLSMLGAYHTSATLPPPAVPLPPSVWLFTSALAMIAVISRRRRV